MKTSLFTLVLTLSVLAMFGQKSTDISQSDLFRIDQVKTQRHTRIANYNGSIESLKNSLENLLNVEGEYQLELIDQKESPGGTHLSFRQRMDGKPIYRGNIKINLDKDGRVISWYQFPIVYEITAPSNSTIPISLNLPANMLPTLTEAVWYPTEEGLQQAFRKEYHSSSGSQIHLEVIESPLNNVIYWKDFNSYSHSFQADTNITVKVFNPDPLTTAQVNYGGVFSDQNDGDVSALNNQRETKSVLASHSQGAFRLENNWVKMEDVEAPNTAVPTSTTPNFDFTRAQSGFEDVNVFYHLTSFQLYMQSLGFQLVNSQIIVDAHGWNGADQSSFSPFGNLLSFGEGGVDDGEDADVIVHEYGHAISHDASPNTNSGQERSALDEAWGDYLAVSYSKSINPHNWSNVFSWDGHNSFWPGRSAVTNKNYQSISFSFNIYEHTDLWSGVLMEIQQQIGRTACDKVVLQGLYHSALNMTYPDAALEIMAADTLLHFGQNAMAIYTEFNNRGILNIPNIGIKEQDLDKSGISVFNSYGFSNGTHDLRLESSQGNFKAVIIDIRGNTLIDLNSHSSAITVSPSTLSQGIYFLQLQGIEFAETIQIIRF